ncbi:MAG: sulfate ABC transporter substrate-binding protein, partial [Planctomycetia bacterium]|nr:sulfate ABC transporter substrate-binding protein [Planctomycetia bacterium]
MSHSIYPRTDRSFTWRESSDFTRREWLAGIALAGGLAELTGCLSGGPTADVQLTNVSYDPTREFYEAYNQIFTEHWRQKSGKTLNVKMSHGGSGRQARAVMDGIMADVVSLALAFDIDMIAEKTGLIDKDWRDRFPHNASPYQSTIVFMVRKGNPKGIRRWEDLIRDDVEVITPHPKTSGAARYNFLAAWGYVLKRELDDFSPLTHPESSRVRAAEKVAEDFLGKMYRNVPVLDSGARGSTMMFTRNRIGDVLLNWENEAFLAIQEDSEAELEIVVPELSILAEPPVAMVDQVVRRRGTTEVARAYLEYLYAPEGQTLAAKHCYRPGRPELVDPSILEKFATPEMFSV